MLKKKDEIIEEKERKISKLVADLMSTQLEFRKVAYLDDSELVAAWKALEQSTNQLVTRWYDIAATTWYDIAATNTVSAGRMSECFERMCPTDLMKHLDLKHQVRRALLEAYIWRVLLTEVFSASGHIWAGKAHDAISRLRSELEGTGSTRLINDRFQVELSAILQTTS